MQLQLDGFNFCKWLEKFYIWSRDGKLTGTTTMRLSWPGSNVNGVLYIPPKHKNWCPTIRWFSVKYKTLLMEAAQPAGGVEYTDYISAEN